MIIFENTRPNIQAFLDFNEAPLFGPEDTERIVSTTHLSAIEEMLDASGLPETEDVQAWLLTQEEFWTIAAYRPETVSQGQVGWTEEAIDHIRERFGEDFGDEDGDDRLSDEDTIEFKRRMAEVVEWYISRCKVWRCAQVRTFTFDSADVLEMIRELRPNWLNKAKTPAV